MTKPTVEQKILIGVIVTWGKKQDVNLAPLELDFKNYAQSIQGFNTCPFDCSNDCHDCSGDCSGDCHDE